MKKSCILVLIALLPFCVYAYSDDENQEMRARIQPIGTLNVQGGGAKPAAAAPVVAAKKLSPGEATYQTYCVTCHAAGIAGAPKAHSAEWNDRKKKGLDGLVQSAIHGLNAMPPKGTCTDCTDAELHAAIEFMLAK